MRPRASYNDRVGRDNHNYNIPVRIPSINKDKMLPRKSGSPIPSVPDTSITLKQEVIRGIPRVAPVTQYNAPVHIDVGGTIYTSTLETLTTFSDSKLCKMFDGTIPIVLDKLKQHYFIDRDGTMFRHILNYLRNKRLVLPTNFSNLDLLMFEAMYFELDQMAFAIEKLKSEREHEDREVFAPAPLERAQRLRREADRLVQEYYHVQDNGGN